MVPIIDTSSGRVFRLIFFWSLTALCQLALGNVEVFCQEVPDTIYLNSISISGAKKTKPGIIYREITILSGRYYPKVYLEAELQRSRQNLMNTSLFNFVDVNPLYSGDTLNVELKVTERWYIWPSPLFEYVDPNFNTWLQTRDLSRTSYGFLVTQYNFRGRNETLRLRAKFGYNEQYSLSYEVPYINKARKLGLGIYFSYYQNYQVNTGTADNKRLFFTKPGGVAREEFSVGTRFQYRKATYGRHYFSLKFNQVDVSDSIALLFPDYLSQGLSERKFLEIGYQFTHDKRDYSTYPLVGTYYTFSIYKPDINLDNGEPTQVIQSFAQLKKYHNLRKNLYFAYSVTGKHTLYKSLPYYFQRGLGYSDFVRGYEYYVVDAQHYAIVKTSLKLRLLAPREFKIGFLGKEKFNRLFLAGYLNVNADAGYAVDKLYSNVNPLANTLLLGGGIGLDLISYYDIVVRCEYSFNRLGQSGFFLHFSRPI